MKRNESYLPFILLVITFVLGFVIDRFLPFELKYSLHPKRFDLYFYKLYWLPLILAFYLLCKGQIIKFSEHFKIISYLSIFLVFSPFVFYSLLFVLFFSLFYLVEKKSRNIKYSSWVLFILFVVFVVAQYLIYENNFNIGRNNLLYLVIFKSAFMMRFLSWLVDRRVYERVNYDTFKEYLEYLFCPVFFIYPGHIQYFLYSYFHQSKKEERVSFKDSVFLVVWAYAAMMIFSFFDSFFWQQYDVLPRYFVEYGYWNVQFLIGAYWLILIYFSQVSVMSFQILMARCLGYSFKYDMHLPLLSRSPLDYLRNHSSYVKDYIVEVGLRPLYLFLSRRGYGHFGGQLASALMAYSLLLFPQIGFRSDYDRSFLVFLVMVCSLGVFIFIPYLTHFIFHTKIDTLFKQSSEKKIRAWSFLDYLKWLGTLITLSFYKMLLGLAK